MKLIEYTQIRHIAKDGHYDGIDSTELYAYEIPAPVAEAADAVIEAAEKATRAWPGSGALTMPALSKALTAYRRCNNETN